MLSYRYVAQEIATHGVEEFFGQFKKQGYTTLFQDSSCWYDKWGTKLEPRKEREDIFTIAERTSRWREYLNLLGAYNLTEIIDDFGMMFLTCSLFREWGIANVFKGDDFPKVCLYGRDYSSLFFEYLEKYARGRDLSDRPFLAYSHLLTGHELTGTRIVNDDVHLARFFHEAARLENTLTIFASDHGVKDGPFSSYTNHGRYEV